MTCVIGRPPTRSAAWSFAHSILTSPPLPADESRDQVSVCTPTRRRTFNVLVAVTPRPIWQTPWIAAKFLIAKITRADTNEGATSCGGFIFFGTSSLTHSHSYHSPSRDHRSSPSIDRNGS